LLENLRSLENSISELDIPGEFNIRTGDPWKIQYQNWRSMENSISELEITGELNIRTGDPWRTQYQNWRSLENSVSELEIPGEFNIRTGEKITLQYNRPVHFIIEMVAKYKTDCDECRITNSCFHHFSAVRNSWVTAYG
jgi:hypothetical protein